MRIPGIPTFLPEFARRISKKVAGNFKIGEMVSKLLVLLVVMSGFAAAHPRPQDEDADSK